MTLRVKKAFLGRKVWEPNHHLEHCIQEVVCSDLPTHTHTKGLPGSLIYALGKRELETMFTKRFSLKDLNQWGPIFIPVIQRLPHTEGPLILPFSRKQPCLTTL